MRRMISAPISRVGNSPPGLRISTAIIASASTISVNPITGSPVTFASLSSPSMPRNPS